MLVKNYKLSNQDIMDAVTEIGNCLPEKKFNTYEVMRIKLEAEDILLDYQEKFGSEQKFNLKVNVRLGSAKIELLIISDEFNPFDKNEDDELVHLIKANIDYDPIWAYINGINKVSFVVRKHVKMSEITRIILALVLGLGLGFLSTTLPNGIGEKIGETVFSPLSGAIMAFLSASAGMLIFVSILNGLTSIGDISEFNAIGKKTIFKLLGMLFIYTIIAIAVLIPLADVKLGKTEAIDISMFYEMLIDIIPKNLIAPFAEGNTLQIVFLSICTGLAMTTLGIKVKRLNDIIFELAQVTKTIVVAITKFMPIVVFVSLYNLAASGTIDTIIKAYKLIVYYLIVAAVFIVFCLARLFITKGVSPRMFLGKISKPLAIIFATSSSVAALPTALDITERKLGVDRGFSDFVLPFEQSVFKPGVAGLLACSAFCMADIYNVEITPTAIITIIISSFFLAIATPPVIGGIFTCVGMLFTQLGIPEGGLAIFVALDVITDRIGCLIVMTTFETEAVQLAGSLKILDKDTLLKK